ncbi:hypothetical protein COSO111634_23445 [Corallococcus soli]
MCVALRACVFTLASDNTHAVCACNATATGVPLARTSSGWEGTSGVGL